MIHPSESHLGRGYLLFDWRQSGFWRTAKKKKMLSNLRFWLNLGKHIFSRIFFFICRLYDKIYHIFLSQNDVDTRRNNRRRRGKKVLRNYFVTFSFCCLVFVLLVNVESQLTLDPISLRCLVHFGGDLRRHRQLQPSEMKERENCCVFSIFTATSSRTISPHHIESKKKQQVKKENWNLNCDPAAVFLKVKKISYFGI